MISALGCRLLRCVPSCRRICKLGWTVCNSSSHGLSFHNNNTVSVYWMLVWKTVLTSDGDGTASLFGSCGLSLVLSTLGPLLFWLLLLLLRRCPLLLRMLVSFPVREHRLQDSFVINRTDEACSHGFVKRIFDSREITRGSHLTYSGCQFSRCLTWFSFYAAPELVSLSDCELGRIVVLGHEYCNITEFHVIGRGGCVLLRCIVVD